MRQSGKGNIMEEHGLKVYTLHTDEFSKEAYFKECYSSLSAYRREKTDSYRFLADKKLSVGAGILLDKGLQEYGLREANVRIAYGENGKPYLPDYPQIHYNLAHSGKMALAAFAQTEVGCDIEEIKAASLKLARRFFCPNEYEYIAQFAGCKQDYAFYRIWTLKESFLKVTGMGMRLSLDAFEFTFSQEGKVSILQNHNQEQYEFIEYDFGVYHAAICVQKTRGSHSENFVQTNSLRE